MADINGVSLQAGSSPTVHYTITYSKSRPNNSPMTTTSPSQLRWVPPSYIHSGYALLCTMTVKAHLHKCESGGGRRRLGRTAPRLRYVTVTCASTTGNTTQGVRFQVVSTEG
jgi:hypothetical protein